LTLGDRIGGWWWSGTGCFPGDNCAVIPMPCCGWDGYPEGREGVGLWMASPEQESQHQPQATSARGQHRPPSCQPTHVPFRPLAIPRMFLWWSARTNTNTPTTPNPIPSTNVIPRLPGQPCARLDPSKPTRPTAAGWTKALALGRWGPVPKRWNGRSRSVASANHDCPL